MNALQTYGSADRVAKSVLFLLRNSFVTGQVICGWGPKPAGVCSG